MLLVLTELQCTDVKMSKRIALFVHCALNNIVTSNPNLQIWFAGLKRKGDFVFSRWKGIVHETIGRSLLNPKREMVEQTCFISFYSLVPMSSISEHRDRNKELIRISQTASNEVSLEEILLPLFGLRPRRLNFDKMTRVTKFL